MWTTELDYLKFEVVAGRLLLDAVEAVKERPSRVLGAFSELFGLDLEL